MQKILITALTLCIVGCATPPKETELDNRTNAITRMCGGGASYINSASFTAKLDDLVKRGIGSASLQTNSDLKTALMSHPAVTDANVDSIFSTFTQCVTTNNLLANSEGCTSVVSMGSGNNVGGDINSTCN